MARKSPERVDPAVDDTPDPDVKVFVSYSRVDTQDVDALVCALNAHGVSTLIDRQDIAEFETWWNRIGALVRQAHVVLIIMTPAWLASETCRRELELAVELGKRLAPIALGTIPTADVPEHLSRLNWFVIRQRSGRDDGIDRLIPALRLDIDWSRRVAVLLELASHWIDVGRADGALLRGEALQAAQQLLIDRPATAPPPAVLLDDYIAAGRAASEREVRQQKEMLDRALVFQSRMLAERAIQEVERGDAVSGALVALEGLPDEGPNSIRPFVPELEAALLRALSETREAHVFSCADLEFHDAAFSDDDRRLFAASDRGIVIWNVETGALLAALDSKAFNISSDVRLVAITSEADVATLWRIEDSGASVPVGSFAGLDDPDLREIFARSGDHWVRVRDDYPPELARSRSVKVKTKTKRLKHFDPHRVRFSIDGGRIAATPAPRLAPARLHCATFRADTGKQIASLDGHRFFVRCIEFSVDSRLVATGSMDRTARVWETETGQCIAELEGHAAEVTCARFSPDGKLVATTAYDNSICVWDVTTARRICVLRGHVGDEPGSTSIFRAFEPKVRFSTSGQFLVSTWKDKTVRLWRVEQRASVATLPGGNRGAVDFSPDGRWVATGDGQKVELWETTLFKCQWRAANLGANDVAFSPDSVFIAAACDTSVVLLHTETGQVHDTIDCSNGSRLAWNSAGDKLAVSTVFDVVVWSVSEGRRISTFSKGGTGYAASFAPQGELTEFCGGELVASCGDEGNVRFWNPENAEEINVFRPHQHSIMDVSFDRRGARLVTASCDTTCAIWADGEPIVRLSGHAADVMCARFNTAGDRIVSSSEDGTVRLWNAVSGKSLAVFHHGGCVWKAVFSPDGQLIASNSSEGTTRIWRIGATLKDLIDESRRILPRVLTLKQRSAAHLEDDSLTWGSESGKWPYETR